MSSVGQWALKLASNDTKARGKAFKSLERWINARSEREDGVFTEDEFLKLWKGLFMCLWHADKPVVQEELCTAIANLIHLFLRVDQALSFSAACFNLLQREWLKIDRLRLDKTYLLIRRVVGQCFQYMKARGWQESLVDKMMRSFERGPFSEESSVGIRLHVAEVLLPELTSADAQVPSDVIVKLVSLSCSVMASADAALVQVLERSLLEPLVCGQALQQVDMLAVSSVLLRWALKRETLGRNRKVLYSLKRRCECAT